MHNDLAAMAKKKQPVLKKYRHKDWREGRALRKAAEKGYRQRRSQVCTRGEDVWEQIENGSNRTPQKPGRPDQLRERLLAKDNRAEDRVCAMLTKLGLEFTREHRIRVGKKVYYVDIAVTVPDIGLVAIEVDGSQHFTADGQYADRQREQKIIGGGWVIGILRLDWATTMRITHSTLMAQLQCLRMGGVLLMY